jgi:hypothetical protein
MTTSSLESQVQILVNEAEAYVRYSYDRYRHNPPPIVKEVLRIYEDIIQRFKSLLNNDSTISSRCAKEIRSTYESSPIVRNTTVEIKSTQEETNARTIRS